jgi:hypothetical protein
VSVTGTGYFNFFGGKISNLTINNAFALCGIKGSANVTTFFLTAGFESLTDCILYSSGTTAQAATNALGSTLLITGCSAFTPSLTLARCTFAGAHSYGSFLFDRANSTITGANQNNAYRFDNLAIDGTVPQITTARKFLTRNTSGQIVEQQIQIDSDYVTRSLGFPGGIQGVHLTFGGYRLTEKFTTLTANPSGTTTLDTSVNSLFYVAGTSNAWVANLSSVNIVIGESCAVTIVCVNGATANFPSSWAYNNITITARTLNGVVYTANPNKTDIINATLMRTGASAYILTVSLSSYA